MSGTFNKSNRPRRAGAYVNFVAQRAATVPPSIGAIVAVPFTHDWGPDEVNVLCGSWQEFVNIYGADQDNPTPGYIAVLGAFRGEGLPAAGRGGAGAVLAYRQVGTSGAKATKTLSNGATNALRLDALYTGSRGSDLKVTVQDHAADSDRDELLVYDGTTLLERYVYDDDDIDGLAAKIADGSDWVAATSLTDGVALTHVTSQALTGGDDGSTVLAGDWTDWMDSLGAEQFGVAAAYGLTDAGILASVEAWQEDANTSGKRFFTVIGGATDEDASDASDRSRDVDDPNVVNVGMTGFDDDDLGVLSPAQLTSRIAGIIAAAGEVRSITGARLAGGTLTNGPSVDEIDDLFDAGVLHLSRDSNRDAPVRIEKGLTTYTKGGVNGAAADPDRPYETFRMVKYVATMHAIDLEFTQWFETEFLGTAGAVVDTAGREAAVGFLRGRLTGREVSRILQRGSDVEVDQDPPPSDDDEFIALRVAIAFTKSAEQIFITVTAR